MTSLASHTPFTSIASSRSASRQTPRRRGFAARRRAAARLTRASQAIEPLENRVMLSFTSSVNVAMIGSGTVGTGGFLPTSGTDLTGINITNLAPASVTAANLAAFDTVIVNVTSPQLASNINNLPVAGKTALVNWLGQGHKLIIRDSECPAQNYSWLPFPFTTNNPGALGASGSLTIVEENTLSTNA